MTPAEFDANCRIFERRCPWLWQTSGYRSPEHNADVGGSALSKHPMGMARDYGAANQDGLDRAAKVALELGFWVVVHDVGSGDHLHLQGLPKGPPDLWWLEKYGGEHGEEIT